jgi:hypothetical protein
LPCLELHPVFSVDVVRFCWSRSLKCGCCCCRHNLWKDGDFVQFVNYLAQASMASAQWSGS